MKITLNAYKTNKPFVNPQTGEVSPLSRILFKNAPVRRRDPNDATKFVTDSNGSVWTIGKGDDGKFYRIVLQRFIAVEATESQIALLLGPEALESSVEVVAAK